MQLPNGPAFVSHCGRYEVCGTLYCLALVTGALNQGLPLENEN